MIASMCRDSHRTSCLCHTVCPCKCSPIRKTQVHIYAHYTHATHKIHANPQKFSHALTHTHTQESLFRSYLDFFERISDGQILHANFSDSSRGGILAGFFPSLSHLLQHEMRWHISISIALLFLLLTISFPRSGGVEAGARKAGEKHREVVLSSTSHDDPDRDLPPLVHELPPEARNMTGDQVYHLGEQLLIRGQSLQAAAFLARAAELMPQDSFSHGNLAIALHQMGRSKEAVPYFRTAAGLNPAALYFANLGQALWSIGEIEEAIAVLRTAVRMDDTQTASMVLLMQLEHYTSSILESWDSKYTACRRHLRRALNKAEAPGGTTSDLIWTPSQIVLLDVAEEEVLRVCRMHTAVPDFIRSEACIIYIYIYIYT